MRAGWFGIGVLAATPAVACETQGLSAAVSDVAGVEGELLWRKAASGILSTCQLRPRVHDMLELVPKTRLADLPKVDLRAAEDDASAWEAACPGGAATLQAAMKQSGGVRNRTLYEQCDVERFKVATADQFAKAAGAPLLAILVAKHLDEQRIHEGISGPLVRALAGLEASQASDTPGTDVWGQAQRMADETATIAWNGWSEAEWLARASELVALCDLATTRPVQERRDHRATEYRACSQAGRAAENANHAEAPLYREVSGMAVNWSLYVAATVATGDDMLLQHETDKDLATSVNYYVGLIKSGKLPTSPPQAIR